MFRNSLTDDKILISECLTTRV